MFPCLETEPFGSELKVLDLKFNSKLLTRDSKFEVLDSRDYRLETRSFRVSRVVDRVELFEFQMTFNLDLAY